MKDLIAKLQLDANCALGAIWMHIDAQAARIAELESEVTRLSASWRGDATVADALEEHIAELEAQIAGASAPVAEQKPVAEIVECDAYPDHAGRIEAFALLPIGTKLYTAPQPADTDKLREKFEHVATVEFSHHKTKAWILSEDIGYTLRDGQKLFVFRGTDAELAASTALQAPVREVPGWQPIETAPKDGTRILVWLGDPWSNVQAVRWFESWQNWQTEDFPEEHDEYCGIGSELPTHWMPLPAAPVQQEGE